MAETINLENSGLLDNLRCAICIDVVHNARLCPCCSQIFCQNCIQYWLTSHSGSCPSSRSAVRYESLLKGHSIDKIKKSADQLISTLSDRICNKHKNQQLSLHCYHCEANICVNCWFSNEHKEHKERTVSVEEAFNHYKTKLETSLSWINAQKKTVDEMLSQVQKLIKKKENIMKICETSMDLIKSDAHPETLMKMLSTAKQIKKLQDKFQAEKESVQLDRSGDFVPQLTFLAFQMADIMRELGKLGKELIVQIRESYVDKFQQMQDHIHRLESSIKIRNRSKAFIKFLVDLWNTFSNYFCTLDFWILVLLCSPFVILLYNIEVQVEKNPMVCMV